MDSEGVGARIHRQACITGGDSVSVGTCEGWKSQEGPRYSSWDCSGLGNGRCRLKEEVIWEVVCVVICKV